MTSKIFFLLLLICVCLGSAVRLRSQEPKLVELRNQFARKYLQPDAHFALAKYYLDNGDYLQAFSIVEYARRNRFEEKDFDAAYIAFFGDPMPEPPAEAKNAFFAGSKLVTEGKYDEAEADFLKANKIYDRSFFINAWIGRFYYKTKSDSSRALPFYFKAYFLYPHAYETEYAESRIRAISIPDAENSFKASLNSGKTLPELAHSKNPLIVSLAIENMARSWKPEYVQVMREAMSNDDDLVRWSAFATLQKYAGASLDKIVDGMLSDTDMRKRGLAAYAIVERPGAAKFTILRKLLGDTAELVRFDAASALALKGGSEAKQILREHQPIEQQPRLKALIDFSLKQKSQ